MNIYSRTGADGFCFFQPKKPHKLGIDNISSSIALVSVFANLLIKGQRTERNKKPICLLKTKANSIN